MDAREAVRQVLRSSPRVAVDDELDVDLSELQVADYLVFILALETYMGWLSEQGHDYGVAETATLRKGVNLAKRAESQNLDAIKVFFKANIGKASIMLLEAALRPPPTPKGLAVRATKLRTLLRKGGPATVKAVFGTSRKAKQQVEAAIDASMLDDPDQALNKLSAFVLRNKRLEAWIDEASEVVPPVILPAISPVQEAVMGASEVTEALVTSQIIQEQPGTEASAVARAKQVEKLAEVEAQATEAAKKALAKTKEPDRPLTKSEVIGVATAAAMAVATDQSNPLNRPPALKDLDAEQCAAAMTGGKVRVSAGAGSGKSFTLLSRVQYLIDEGAVPERMIAMSFNTKAAKELAVKMAAKLGDRKVDFKARKRVGVKVGTMHSLFLSYIGQFGTPQQKQIFAKVTDAKGQKRGGIFKDDQLFKVVKDIWDECFANIDHDPPGDPNGSKRKVPNDELWKMPPKSKRMRAYFNVFQGEGMSMEQVKAWVVEKGNIEAFQAGKFYEIYEGIKGALGPNWRPNLCDRPSPSTRGGFTAFNDFVNHKKMGKPRIGDFNDMLSVFRDILRDNPIAREKLQSQLDHVMVDECQDLNPLQMEVLQYMTGHITTDDPKRSFWMVGDDKQSIYQFRGADPDNFINLDKQGFKDRQITTNYRCAPEFVEAANRLIANNKNQIPMEAKPRPDRAKGEANLLVTVPHSEAGAASDFGKKILEAIRAGMPLSDYAVLARTNKELGYYQQVCSTAGIPFVQKRASAVFSSQESETFRAFMQTVVAEDAKTMQEGFLQALFSGGLKAPYGEDRAEAMRSAKKEMQKVFAAYAKSQDTPLSSFDPVNATMEDPALLTKVIQSIGGRADWQARKEASDLMPLVEGIAMLRGAMAEAEGQTTPLGTPAFSSNNLFDAILQLPIIQRLPPKFTLETKTFKDATHERINARMIAEGVDELDPELADGEGAGSLGALDFVQIMMVPDATDSNYNAQDPKQFYAKFNGLADRAEELRIDPDEWEKKQDNEKVPMGERKPPPGVFLGTVHSTKGAEWPDVTLLMPKGKFPSEYGPRQPGDNEVPEYPLVDSDSEMEAERRLGYVGITRAQNSLTIACPRDGEKGGPSPFVFEAGLVPGQNVTKDAVIEPLTEEPQDEEPEEEEGPPPTPTPDLPPEVRMASLQGLRALLSNFRGES